VLSNNLAAVLILCYTCGEHDNNVSMWEVMKLLCYHYCAHLIETSEQIGTMVRNKEVPGFRS
jgi:hypothetical protein